MAHDFSRHSIAQEPPGQFEYSDDQFPSQRDYQSTYSSNYPPSHRTSQTDYERMLQGQPSHIYGGGNMPDSRYQQERQPINAAVTSAFDRANTSSHIPPELIDQITQSVIQQLKATPLDQYQPQQQPQPTSSTPPPAGSLSNTSGTVPSANNRNEANTPSPTHRSDETVTMSSSIDTQFQPQPQPSTEPPTFTGSGRPLSVHSQTSDTARKASRPQPPQRLPSGTEETTLEKIWGPLFDQEGRVTPRLGQFLRGIAVHLIEDYEPLNSLVITPTKMQKFYEDTKLSNEKYPWNLVFDHNTSSISRMYRDVECQHHLVQEDDHFVERPDIPGLTPHGFERWETLLIRANPEAEYDRLQKAVLDMPISNPDDKKERFPKEISRRLFPKDPNIQLRERLEQAMITHCSIDIPKSSISDPQSSHKAHQRADANIGSPVASSNPSMQPPPVASNLERSRQPYSGAPCETPIDAITPPAQSFERERKPYTAQPGAGKNYDDDHKRGPAKLGRSDSNASSSRPAPLNPTNQRVHDLPMPEPGHHHTLSGINAASASQRHRSPSMTTSTGGDFRRSEGDFFSSSYGGPPYGSSHMDDTVDDEARRFYKESSLRDDGRIYETTRDRGRHDRGNDHGGVPRSSYRNDDEYYRSGGRAAGNGYDYTPPYPSSSYR